MTNRLTRTMAAAGMILALASPALAQVAPVTLSLDDAIARGTKTAPRIAEAQARQEAADAALTSREALKMPSLSTSAGYQRTNNVDDFGITLPTGTSLTLFKDIPNNFRLRADASMPVYTSGRTEALIAAASLDTKATAADTRTATADVALDVARAYWTLVTARETAKVVEQGLVRIDAYVSDVKARVNTGFLPPNDLLSAQAQRARQNVSLIQARNAAALAQADLCRLVGLDLDTPIVTSSALMAPDPASVELTTKPVAALVEQARGGRSERDALSLRADAARQSGVAAASALKPIVGAAAGFEESRPNQRIFPRVEEWRSSWEIGMSVSWQLFDGGKSKADRAAATAQALAIERRRDDFDAMLGVELRQRRLDVEAGKAALDASAEGVAAATEARRVVEERFKAGVSTSTDVLDAQTALLEAELQRTQLAAQLRLSEARLLRAVGGR